MTDNQQPTPPTRNLTPEQQQMEAQAIPLDSPVIRALRDFATQAATSRATALVVVCATETGVAMATVMPGGFVQGYGLLQQALVLLQQQQQAQRQQGAPPQAPQ